MCSSRPTLFLFFSICLFIFFSFCLFLFCLFFSFSLFFSLFSLLFLSFSLFFSPFLSFCLFFSFYGDTRAGECKCLVITGDVLSFALVTSDFFPPKSTSVLFGSTQCKFCVTSVELVEQLLLSTACIVRELSGTSCACPFLCRQFFLVM